MPIQIEGVLPAGADTLLTISGMGEFQFQARGLTQTLSPIRQAMQVERTVNGKLKDISNPIFRKYATKISCSDVNLPPFDGIWPGMEVTIDCAIWLCYPNGNSGSPFRDEVSGSSYVLGGMTYYRPILTCLILDPKTTWEEWHATGHWEINGEEV